MPRRQFRKKPVRRRPRRAPKATFAKNVLSVLNRQRELKCVFRPTAPNLTVDNTILQTDLLQLLPDIGQGTNEFQRIGNTIMLKKLVVRGYYMMNYPSSGSIDRRVCLRHMVLKQKNCNSADQLINGGASFLNNTILEQATPYYGNISSFMTPINKTAFTVKKDLKKVKTLGSYSAGASTGVDMSDSYWLFEYTINFGKGKELNYRTSGAVQPADFPYFLAHSASPLGTNSAMNPLNVLFNMTTTAYYYD